MPGLSVLLVRAALLHLALGASLGGLILLGKGDPALAGAWQTLPAHVDVLLAGWMAQLAMGVAFWILPRFRSPLPPRGDERLVRAAFLLLNGGVLLVVAVTLLAPASTVGGEARLLGRLAVAVAVALFARHAWPRAKTVGAP